MATTVRILNARPTWMDKTPGSSGDSFDGAPAIRLCSYRLPNFACAPQMTLELYPNRSSSNFKLGRELII